MFIQTESGLTFGRNFEINKDHIAFEFILKALKIGREDIAEKLIFDLVICNIHGVTCSLSEDNNKIFLFEEIPIPLLVQKILIKYIYLFELENINYRFILCNIIKNLIDTNEKYLSTTLEHHMPITRNGRFVVLEIEGENKTLVSYLPKDLYNLNSKEVLEYDFDNSRQLSILYDEQNEFGLKGGL